MRATATAAASGVQCKQLQYVHPLRDQGDTPVRRLTLPNTNQPRRGFLCLMITGRRHHNQLTADRIHNLPVHQSGAHLGADCSRLSCPVPLPRCPHQAASEQALHA
ncbi:hypothetical protein HaLaN_15583, partial [Haematococcus lacustris]